jgi:hypothetical protein
VHKRTVAQTFYSAKSNRRFLSADESRIFRAGGGW